MMNTDPSSRSLIGNEDVEMVEVEFSDDLPAKTSAPAENETFGGERLNNPRRSPSRRTSESLFFRDEQRRIDFVLAFVKADGEREIKNDKKRKVFLANIKEEGLELEFEDAETSQDGKTHFVKIHASWDFLTRTAEIMRIKLPIKENELVKDTKIKKKYLEFITSINPFDWEIPEEYDEPDTFNAPFNRSQQDQFIGYNAQATFFSPIQRSRMVYDTLRRAVYDKEVSDRMGILRLIQNGTYCAAFPLHEGPCDDEVKHGEQANERQFLYENWARWRRIFKYQPIDQIRSYFGEQIGFYFAWLGFYTEALIPAALIGIICVIYGSTTLVHDIPSDDVCDKTGVGAIWMCPQCDSLCPYWPLNVSCLYSQFTYVFDNYATVVFAVFMSVWATLFLEFWKRRQAELAWDWDVMDFELEEVQVRPEYSTQIKSKRKNPVTDTLEPYMKRMIRYVRLMGSFSACLFFLCLLLAFVIGVITYRVIIVHFLWKADDKYLHQYAKIVTSITAACINLMVIMVLGRIYQVVALQLTDWEMPRTQPDWENSYTFKVFSFQFINNYSSLFYIAFFKGKLTGAPNSKDYAYFGSYRQEECDPAGCMVELLIQLAVIMSGKQVMNNSMEIVFPILQNWYRNRTAQIDTETNKYLRWEKDYNLNMVPNMPLFNEYLEMVMQYGFITLFVAAFPVAPFFALMNNLLEIRLDAYKFTVAYRRTRPVRVHNLGVWYNILDAISNFAVLTNACVIAFTSDFIPRVVYQVVYSCDHTLQGYMQNSLSWFAVADFSESQTPSDRIADYTPLNGSYCRFKDYRNPPCNASNSEHCMPDWYKPDPSECSHTKYHVNMQWWHVFAARLFFVLVFEHIVFIIKAFVAYFIPDVPDKIAVQVQREQYLSRVARQQNEISLRAKERQNGSATPGPQNNGVPLLRMNRNRTDSVVEDELYHSSRNSVNSQYVKSGAGSPNHSSPNGNVAGTNSSPRSADPTVKF